jgi:hypothetical protein
MGFAHHGSNEESQLMKLFIEQTQGRAKRAFSEGRINATDDGDLACAITTDRLHGKIVMDFGKPVTWLAMTPADAVSWAKQLIQRAREISKEPIVLEL